MDFLKIELILTVDFSGDVKLGDTKKIIITLKVRGGHGV